MKSAILLFFSCALLFGVAYPLAVTAIAQLLFSDQAQGSLVRSTDGTLVIGSTLLGQEFTASGYLWGRPSATSPAACNPALSTGSNLSPTGEKMQSLIRSRASRFSQRGARVSLATAGNAGVPVDLLQASGSGLDPHISPAAAEFQVFRIAGARAISPEAVRRIIREKTEPRALGLFGAPRVNVLMVNLELDRFCKRLSE